MILDIFKPEGKEVKQYMPSKPSTLIKLKLKLFVRIENLF